VPPVLPSGVAQFYLEVAPVAARPGEQVNAQLIYQPRLLGFVDVAFPNKAGGADHRRLYRLLALAPGPNQAVAWGSAEAIADGLAKSPDAHEARWADVPESVNDSKKLKTQEKSLVEFLYSQAAVTVFQNKAVELCSETDEDYDSFKKRCTEEAKRKSEVELSELQAKYRVKLAPLESSLRDSHSELQKTRAEFRAPDQVINQGGSLLDFLWSWSKPARQPVQVNTAEVGRRMKKQQTEIERRESALEKAKADWEAAVNRLQVKWQQKAEEIKEVRLSPRKSDIRITHFGLAWAPFWHITAEGSGASLRLLPAYARPK